MLDDKKLKELQNRVKIFIKDGTISKSRSNKEHVQFFIENAKESLDTANIIYDISTKQKLSENIGRISYKGFLWVINTSYYSMFYMARALLEKEGVKLKSDLSVHMLTFDALVHYFYLTGKLQKQFMEAYAEAEKEAAELLGKEKAHTLIQDYFYEKDKRATFTYQMGEKAFEGKAKTSLERAQNFFTEISKMIND